MAEIIMSLLTMIALMWFMYKMGKKKMIDVYNAHIFVHGTVTREDAKLIEEVHL